MNQAQVVTCMRACAKVCPYISTYAHARTHALITNAYMYVMSNNVSVCANQAYAGYHPAAASHLAATNNNGSVTCSILYVYMHIYR